MTQSFILKNFGTIQIFKFWSPIFSFLKQYAVKNLYKGTCPNTNRRHCNKNDKSTIAIANKRTCFYDYTYHYDKIENGGDIIEKYQNFQLMYFL